jgi:hypothetical protein
VPGKEEGAGAHQSGGPTVRQRKRRRAAVFNGGGVGPVVVDECGGVLYLEGDQGVRRRWSIEEWSTSKGHGRMRRTTWGGGSAGGRWLPFKGATGDNREGGGSGSGEATRRGGGRRAWLRPAGERVRSGARVAWPGETRSGPSPG